MNDVCLSYNYYNKLRYQRMTPQYIIISINKYTIYKIIKELLDYCKMTVIGYNKYNDLFWCKKYHNYDCIIHYNIKIIDNDEDTCKLLITSLIGNVNDIKNFINNINDFINIYKSCSFIRNFVESSSSF
jgi:hypothetical protein